MATVTGYTKAKMDEIVDATIVSGTIDGFGHLILTTSDATEIDAGAVLGSVPDASLTVKGIVELATDAETITGADTARAVTPSNLQAKVASDTAKGIVELATDAEAIAGTDTARAVTPANLQAKVASETAKGIVELATDAETITGTDTARAVTPANLQAKVASATAKGIVELATDAEAIAGTDTVRAITPANLAAVISGIQEFEQLTSGNVTSASYVSTLSAGSTPSGTFVAPASGKVLVHISAYITTGTSGAIAYMTFEIRTGAVVGSGTQAPAAADANGIMQRGNSTGSDDQQCGTSKLITGLTPGATYNIQGWYKTSAGTATYINRRIIVDPK